MKVVYGKEKRHKGTGEYIEIDDSRGMWEDYLHYGTQYDIINDCPIIPGETKLVERQRLSKISKDSRNLLKEYLENAVRRFWSQKRQIPVSGDLNVLRQDVLEIFLSDLGICLKDDKDVTLFLDNTVAPTINRILRTEKM